MSDPTMQGTPPGTVTVRYSLAEIDALCRKAARGAGCPWGLAEEAGKAARWLAARGLPGPEALAALLAGARNCPCAGVPAGDAPSRPECALRLGSSLSDRADRITGGEVVSVDVAQPLLVLAQLGRAATATNAGFRLEWAGVQVLCGLEGPAIDTGGELLAERATLRCEPSDPGVSSLAADCRSRPVDAEAWTALERLAARTYAPATDASRLAGAGAGLVDND